MDLNKTNFPHLVEFGKEMFKKYPMTEYANELRIDDEVGALFAYVTIMRNLTNEMIDVMGELGGYVGEIAQEFSDLRDWVENEGMRSRLLEILNDWLADGTLAQVMNTEIFNMKVDKQVFEQFVLQTNYNLNNKRDKNKNITLNDIDSTFLLAIQGGSGTSFEIESIPRDSSVTQEKTTFAQRRILSNNLVDPKQISNGVTLNATTGEVLQNELYNLTGKTNLQSNSVYYVPYTTNFYKFDLNGNYVGYEQAISITTTESILVRIRISAGSTEPFRLNKGELKPYDTYKEETYIPDIYLDNQKVQDVTFPNKKLRNDLVVSEENASFLERKSENLFNNQTTIKNKRLSVANTMIDDLNNDVSMPMPVKGSTYYSVTEGNFTHYLNENGEYITGHGTGIKTFMTTPETRFIQTTVRKTKLDVFMMIEGETPPSESDYVPYNVFVFTGDIDVAKSERRFENQTLAFNGDSIIENGGYMVSKIKNALGFKSVVNYGVGGTAYATRNEPWDTNAISIRYKEMDNNFDCVAILAGTNDFKSPEINLQKFRAAVRTTFEGLVEKYPTSKLYIFTMPPRYDTAANGETVFQYADVLSEEAGRLSIPCCDLLRFSQLRPWNEQNKAKYITDGLHPTTPDGYDVMIPRMIDFMNHN